MPIISSSVQNNGGSASPGVGSQSRSYRSGGSTLTLREGQVLKGVVSDVHGNEITLSMDDGSSFTGKLPDASQYSIGQKAAFRITSLGDNTIYMKATSGAYLLDMEDTVEQALEEAGLPKSTRNLDVVRSLLQNQQSISRENIMSSIRLCAKYPQADVNSVITMNRLGMAMTEASVKQFESYQNQTHQLLYQMDALGDAIGDMLQSIGAKVPRLAKEACTQLLLLALEGEPTPEEQQLAARSALESETSGLPEDEEGTRTDAADGAPREEAAGTAAEKETAPGTIAEKEAAAENTAEASGAFARMRQLFSAITDGNAAVRNAMAESGMTQDFRTPFIHEQVGFLLDPEERTAFTRELSGFPLSEELKQGVADGTITLRNFLTEIQKAFAEMSEEQAGRLLTSRSFRTIVKGQFLTNWTLSPEQLKEEGAPDQLYQKMSRQFEALSHFSENVLGRDLFREMSQNAADMNDNLNFMKALNETYQYIQLPLKLQDQNAHGDLYVMTKKSSLKKDPKHLKVLLHLDMEHLGALDIHITRENTSVKTQFFVSDEDTLRLLEKNIHLLSDAINEQGFSFSSDLSIKEKEVDIVNDFVSSESPVGDIKRYNFDLRA